MKNKLNIYVTKTYKSIGSEIIKLLDLIDFQCKIYIDDLNFKEIKKTYKKEYNLIIYPYHKIIDYDNSKIEPSSYFLYLLEYFDIQNEILKSFIDKSIHTFYVNKYSDLHIKNMSHLPIPIHEINEIYEYDIVYYGKLTDRIELLFNELLLNFNTYTLNSNDDDDDINEYLSKSQILLLLNDNDNLINEFALCQAIKYNIRIIVEKNNYYLQDNAFLKQYRNNIHFINEVSEDNFESVKRYLQNFIINKNNISNFTFLNTFSPFVNVNINFTNIHDFAQYYKYNDIYRCINDIKHDKKVFHRFNCYNSITSIKNIRLNEIDEDCENESVLIEFRSFPHLEFLLRNTIHKLGPKWKHTVVCGNINFNMISKICENINLKVNIIKLNLSHVTRKKYCEMFLSKEFWDLFTGEKLLIYQEDTCIFKKNIDDFLEYDYIGAPWPKHQKDNLLCVGNGGFSLRTKDIMIEVIDKVDPSCLNLNENTMNYIKRTKLNFIPEDIYFTKSMIEHNIGTISPWNIAQTFSQESVESKDPFAGHCFWNSSDVHKIISLLSLSSNEYYKNNTLLVSIVNNFNNTNIISENLNTNKVVFIEDIIKYFVNKNNISTPWLGLLNIFDKKVDDFDSLFNNELFVKSLSKCKGIIVYHKDTELYCNETIEKYNKKVQIIYVKLPIHINTIDYKQSTLDNIEIYFLGCDNENNVDLLINMNCNYKKNISLIDYESYDITTNEFTYKVNQNNINLIIENSKNSFIENIKSNIVFLYIEPYTKTDKIILLIEYNIPFFINKTSSTIEYLGSDYPLYYENIEDLESKINDNEICSLLENGYKYLKEMNKKHMSYEYFNSIIMSLIN